MVSPVSDRKERVQQMLDSQHHRGPDYAGLYDIDSNATFGHNRLAIIDLTPDGNQPFLSNTDRYCLTFNGEIYNYIELRKEIGNKYPFKTRGDVEVLLAAYIVWGDECLDKLIGMFSFAIWDRQEKKLFAARDRFGVKPFNYSLIDGNFMFSSEIKALWKSGLVEKKMKLSAWSTHMTHALYPTMDGTFWEGVQQLPAGHSITYEHNNLKVNRWYNFEQRVENVRENLPIGEAQSKLKDLLLQSIKYRLRSDVKRGFNLSGGIDSSLLFSLIKSQLDPALTKAYTFYSGHDGYDEIKWAGQVIEKELTEWRKVPITAAEIPSLASFMTDKQDEPYSGIAVLAYAKTFEYARKDGHYVVLDGEGMDEQVLGYDYYTNSSNSIIQGLNHSSPVRPNCLDKDFLALATKPQYDRPFDTDYENMQYRDIIYSKIPRSVRFNDRMSMAYSVELREPFLDHNLFEYNFSLPVKYKIREGQKKWMLRRILREFIQGDISEAPKRPIQTPQREWLAHDLKDWTADYVALAIRKYDFLNGKEIDRELDKFFKGESDNSFYIWQWIGLGLFSEFN